MSCERFTPAARARRMDVSRPLVSERQMSRAKGCAASSPGLPRVCIRISGRAVAARDLRKARIKTQPADVIHNVGAGVKSLLRNLRLGGVDGDGDAGQFAPQVRDDRQHAPKLLLRRNGLRPRPRGLAAHVDPIGPLAGQFHAVLRWRESGQSNARRRRKNPE